MIGHPPSRLAAGSSALVASVRAASSSATGRATVGSPIWGGVFMWGVGVLLFFPFLPGGSEGSRVSLVFACQLKRQLYILAWYLHTYQRYVSEVLIGCRFVVVH